MTAILTATIRVEDESRFWSLSEPGHLERIRHQAALHMGLHAPTHNLATIQIKNNRQIQPASIGLNISDVACPNTVRCVRLKVSVEQIRRNRQIVLAVGGHDEFTLSVRFDAMHLHEPQNPFLPNSHAISPKFSPDPRPAIFAFGFLHAQP